MRYFRIFLLHLQDALQYRSRSFVWFLTALFSPLLLLLFWRGALSTGKSISTEWDLSSITSYYLLFIIVGSLLVIHIEESISREDVQKGQMVKYLTKPFSYYWIKFFEEAPYRIMQGFYGLIVYILIISFNQSLLVKINPETLLFTIAIFIFGYLISYTYKMILGIAAFWLTDAFGFYQFAEVIFIIFAGFIMPLDLLPDFVRIIALIMPFAYMIYYPVIALQGNLSIAASIIVLGSQIFWLLILVMVYRRMYKLGTREFTAVGQ